MKNRKKKKIEASIERRGRIIERKVKGDHRLWSILGAHANMTAERAQIGAAVAERFHRGAGMFPLEDTEADIEDAEVAP